jgi:transglutaminase-like putative cysteine protease
MGGHLMPLSRILRSAMLVVVVLLLAAGEADRTERWFEVRVGGRPAGWTRSLETRVPEGWRTETETRLRLGRGTALLDMATTGWIVEGPDGKPIHGGRTQSGSGQAIRVTWRYLADGIQERTMDGARLSERKLPSPPAEALGPHAADVQAARLRDAGATELEQWVFEPTQGPQPQRVKCSRGADEEVKLTEGPRQAQRWALEGALVPKGTVEWRDAAGELLRSVSPTGLGQIESQRSTESVARGWLAKAAPPPEVMVASFARPDRPLRDPASLRRMRVRLSAREGELDPPPSVGFQRVASEGGVHTVTVDLDAPTTLGEPSEEFLVASPMIDGKDPVIVAIANAALADAPADPRIRLERLRSATWTHLERKNLASALASASEAARSRSGDCTEHAVLLAALLRAQGIPSRVVAGLVWCDQFSGEREVFGWHLWTQAMVDRRWIDLDATLPPGGPGFHPGHVAMAATALADPAADASWTTLVGALGNLRIEIMEGARE